MIKIEKTLLEELKERDLDYNDIAKYYSNKFIKIYSIPFMIPCILQAFLPIEGRFDSLGEALSVGIFLAIFIYGLVNFTVKSLLKDIVNHTFVSLLFRTYESDCEKTIKILDKIEAKKNKRIRK